MNNNDKTVNEFFEDIVNKNTQLLSALTLYRFERELKMVEEVIEANKQVPTKTESKIMQITIDNTVNAYRRMKTQKFSDKKKICQDNIAAFREKCDKEGIELPETSEENLRQLIAQAFEDDVYGLQKICFVIICSLQSNSEEFIYGDKTLEDISVLLFDDESRIKVINEKFYQNFKEISNGSFWERNMKWLIGVGISMLIALVFGSAFFGGAALLGLGGLAISELVKYEKVKEAFRQLKPNDTAALFAMKATLLDFGIPAMGADRGKKELDECLSSLNDLRADLEYMLIVEKSDKENNKKKIQFCNRFVDHLAVIA